MTFLPVVERELRVAARKRSTFWLRIIAALVGLLIGGACLLLGTITPFGLNNLGTALFGILTYIGVAAALVAGLFLTSDCLSEEKREGTLGFLFLTDLRGYDVVGGKLLATSLRGLYALLAVFPILAVTLLMGGVTGGQFWRTALALLNCLVFSLAVGMAVSALSRDFQKALAATLLLMLLLTAGGPIADATIAESKGRGFIAQWSLSSPGYVFAIAGAWGRNPDYWNGLLITQAIAWLFLALACVLIPRTWQERASRAAAPTSTLAYSWKYGGARRRASLRRKLLDKNAVLWLASRERWQSLGIWFLALVSVAAFIVLLVKLDPDAWMAWRFIGGLFFLAVYLWTASQACRFFVEARRSGLIELLLSTPMTVAEIVRGQWRGLLRLFGAPVILLLGTHIAALALSQQSWGGLTGRVTGGGADVALSIATTIASALTTLGNLLALCWFGMWMGMTSRNNNLATLKTILFVQVVPWFVIAFSSSIASAFILMPGLVRNIASGPGSTSVSVMVWYPLISVGVATVLAMGKDIAFILFARNRLYSCFRDQAVRSASPISPAPIPVPPLPVSPPPIIASQ